MDIFLNSAQVVICLLVIFLIFIQTKGNGFGRSSGGGSSFTRRGLERLVFRSTFAFVGVFIALSILQLFI